jgi:hypothetical protein
MGVEENGSAAALGTNGNHALEHEVVLGGSEGLSTNHEGGGTHKEGATTEQITDLNGGGGEVTKSSWFKASLLWKGSSTFDSFLLAQAAQVSLWVCVLVFCVLSLCLSLSLSLSLSLTHTHTHTHTPTPTLLLHFVAIGVAMVCLSFETNLVYFIHYMYSITFYEGLLMVYIFFIFIYFGLFMEDPFVNYEYIYMY